MFTNARLCFVMQVNYNFTILPLYKELQLFEDAQWIYKI